MMQALFFSLHCSFKNHSMLPKLISFFHDFHCSKKKCHLHQKFQKNKALSFLQRLEKPEAARYAETMNELHAAQIQKPIAQNANPTKKKRKNHVKQNQQRTCG